MREQVEALERAVSSAALGDLPALLGDLERLRVIAWQRTLALQVTARPEAPGKFADRLTITTTEAAEWLGVDEDHVQALCRSGAIQASKPGKAWLIRPDALADWVAKQEDGHQARRGRSALASALSRRRSEVRLDALPQNSRRTA